MTALRAPLKLAGVVALLWTTILLGLVPQSLLDRDSAQSLVYSIPVWTFVSVGVYCVATLVWGVATFRDCPEAHAELLGEIKQARDELRAKGVRVD